MQRDEGQPTWRDWRLVILLGLPLGLLELGLFAVAARQPFFYPPWNMNLLDWLLYFLIAGIIEFQFCWRRRHAGWDASGAGFLAALVGCTIFMLGVAVWLIISIILYEHTPHPPPAPVIDSPVRAPPTQDPSSAFLLLMTLAFFNIVTLAFSAVGARIGKALAMWRANRFSE